MDVSKFNDFEKKSLVEQIKYPYEIQEIFHLGKRDEHTRYFFIFKYNETLLCSNVFSKNPNNSKFDTEFIFNEIQVSINEYEDLKYLYFKGNRYDQKFLDFLYEQVLLLSQKNTYRKYPFWVNDATELKKDLDKFISSLKSDGHFPIKFCKLYDIILNDFLNK